MSVPAFLMSVVTLSLVSIRVGLEGAGIDDSFVAD